MSRLPHKDPTKLGERVKNNTTSEQIRRLYNHWCTQGREEEWHRLASTFVLPQQEMEMLLYFEKHTYYTRK